MKRLYKFIVPVVLLFLISSCSTYKNTSVTPDDVYYSPGTPSGEAAAKGTNSDYYSTPNENYVKMRVQNPDRWSYFDDYNYDYYGGYSPYSAYSPYGYGGGFGMSMSFGSGFYGPCYGGFGYYSPLSYYNSYYAWNNFYNPYYGGVVVINGKNTTTPSYTRMSSFNPSAYQGRYYNERPAATANGLNYTRNSQNYNPRNNFNQSTNNRQYYNNNNSTNSSSPARSSGGFSGGGGGASRGGGFSRPGR
jgi:uncharacterized membrane protein YgcG